MGIHELAYDGNLEEVKKSLKDDPALLNAGYAAVKEPVTTILQATAWVSLGAKKFVGGFAFLTMCLCVGGVVAATDGIAAGPVLASGLSGSVAYTGLTTFGDERFYYYTQDKTGFTPLHCAALGYQNGNKNALNVALYLIEQGADTDIKISGITFLDFDDDLFKSQCNNAITQKKKNNDTDAEINRLRPFELLVSCLEPGVNRENEICFFVPRRESQPAGSAEPAAAI